MTRTGVLPVLAAVTMTSMGGAALAWAPPPHNPMKDTAPGPAASGAPRHSTKAWVESSDIELWVRGPGKLVENEAPRRRSERVDLDKLPLVNAERFDVQYRRTRPYRGIPLSAVYEHFAPEASLDLAILHFANGMAVPLPFRDPAVMKRLDPFVARGITTLPPKVPQMAGFPDLPKRNARADARPIRFSGNKIVVAESWHPDVGEAAQKSFSPWAHTDTLVGIEFVEARPYQRQFDVDDSAEVQRGLALFQQTCQFCHGANKIGASFGWDFVEPLAVYSYRKPDKELFFHVARKPFDAAERGLMMPALKFMTPVDAADVWQWLRAVATKPMPPYTVTAIAAH